MDLESRSKVFAALGDPLRLRMVDALALHDLTPHELAQMMGLESNLVAHHLGVLERAGVITRKTSWGDRRRRYVVLDRDLLSRIETSTTLPARSVLFICTHNSARSQLAEAVMRNRSPIPVQSAGMDPAPSVHPKAQRVAAENGLDLSRHQPKPYEAIRDQPDLVVSVCDRACESHIPFSGRRLHWSIPDPVEVNRLETFREVFAEISERVEQLVGIVDPKGENR